MKSKYNFWSQEQLDFLLINYGKIPVPEIGEIIKKSIGSIYYILDKENVDLKEEFWSKEEFDYLKENYSKLSTAELRNVLKRSDDAIQIKAERSGLKKDLFWTDFEISELKKMKEAGFTYNNMAIILNRSKSAIHNKLVEFGLTGNTRRWSEDELEIMENMAVSGKFTYTDIALKIKAMPEQIRSACSYRKWNGVMKSVISAGEILLYDVLHIIFPDMIIETQFHIGEGMRLDCFIPEINLGCEFDGLQHFEKVSKFKMTDEDLAHIIALDKRKNEKCCQLGISLIRIKYNEPITKESILSKYRIVGNGQSSKELEKIKSTGGYLSESSLHNKLYKIGRAHV